MQTDNSLIDFDDHYRRRAHRKYAPIDAERTPEDIKDDAAYQELREQMHMLPPGQTKSWIDRVIPYILILGFMTFCFGSFWVLDWLMFTVIPAVL